MKRIVKKVVKKPGKKVIEKIKKQTEKQIEKQRRLFRVDRKALKISEGWKVIDDKTIPADLVLMER